MTASMIGVLLGTGVAMLAPSIASAWHFDYRFVQRVGMTDIPLAPGVVFAGSPGSPIRLRIQFGVFDDVASAAPAGGLVGWVVGSITDSISSHNTRTPGRITPFNFAAGGNGTPSGDPFVQITNIDCTLGTQSPAWRNDAFGNPLPVPQPTIRGINTFVSIYEITTTPGTMNYTITAAGNLIAASGWGTVGAPVSPNNNGTPLDPSDDTPGSVTWVPIPLPPQSFLLPPLVLDIVVPSPAAGTLLAWAGALLVVARRRR